MWVKGLGCQCAISVVNTAISTTCNRYTTQFFKGRKTVKLSLKKLLIQDNFHTKLMIGLYQKLILMHNDVRCMLIICDQLKV